MRFFLALCVFLSALRLQAQQGFTRIKMERTPCFGACPAYSIEFRNTGEVLFAGKKNALFDGTIRGRLPKSEWTKLAAKHKKIPWQKLPGQYKVMTHDVSKVHFKVLVNGKTYSIRNADDGPDYLTQLTNDLQTLMGKKVIWDKKSFRQNPVIQEISQEQEGPGLQELEEPAKVTIAQEQEVRGGDEVFTVVEQMPEFPGGQDAMMTFLRSNLQYPIMAKEAGVQGKVICAFVVDQEGQINEVTVLRGIGHGCDQEAIRVIRSMPRWNPGRQNGQKVKVKFHLPISFKLQ